MKFRFRKYNEENKNYDFITSCDIEDFDKMYNTLILMKENQLDSIEINTENMVDTLGENYRVKDVAFCVSMELGEEALLPVFVVDIDE